MRMAYVAGPYRDSRGHFWISKNIEAARSVAAALWERGFAAICPHMNTAHFDGLCHDEVWLAGGLAILKRCDIVVLTPRWATSHGTIAELREADRLRMPIYEWPNMEHVMIGRPWEHDVSG